MYSWVDKIFGPHFWDFLSPPSPSKLFFQKLGSVTILTWWSWISWGKKSERNWWSRDLSLLTGRKTSKAKFFRILRVDVQLVSAPLKMLWSFSSSMEVHSCETFGGIICITNLIQAETTVSRKASTWRKGNKDSNRMKLK